MDEVKLLIISCKIIYEFVSYVNISVSRIDAGGVVTCHAPCCISHSGPHPFEVPHLPQGVCLGAQHRTDIDCGITTFGAVLSKWSAGWHSSFEHSHAGAPRRCSIAHAENAHKTAISLPFSREGALTNAQPAATGSFRVPRRQQCSTAHHCGLWNAAFASLSGSTSSSLIVQHGL